MSNENTQEERQLWKKRIEDLNTSGLSVTQFAKVHGFSIHQIYYWKTKLTRRRHQSLPLKAEPSSPAVKVIRLPEVKSSSLPDPKWVAALIKALSEDE